MKRSRSPSPAPRGRNATALAERNPIAGLDERIAFEEEGSALRVDAAPALAAAEDAAPPAAIRVSGWAAIYGADK